VQTALREWVRRLWGTLRLTRTDRDLEEELRTHFELAAEDARHHGASPDDAGRAARLRVGGAAQAMEALRDQRGLPWLNDLRHDLRYALRTLKKSPGFGLVVILTLALGIGATTAIYSVVHAVLMKPLAYSRESDRLVRLIMNMPASVSPTGRPLRTTVSLSAAEIRDLESRSQALSGVGTVGPVLMGLSGYEEAAHLQGSRVSATVFSMIDARPLLGRVFDSNDEAPGADPVILISFAAWHRYFAADPNILNRTLTLDTALGPRRQSRYTVIGVMPQRFAFPSSQTQFWMPFQATVPGGGAAIRGPMLGRLAHGISMQAAVAEIGPIVREIRLDKPGITYELLREQDGIVAQVKPALLVLTVAVGFVLLIACVNVANLLLARMAARQREIAIRGALGAGRGRLIRQVLTESVVLAMIGGVAGTALAFGGITLLQMLATTLSRIDLGTGVGFPRLDEIGIDGSVLLYTAATSVVTGLAVGLLPAFRYARRDPMESLRAAAGASASPAGVVEASTLRGALVVIQIALAMILLVGGGLLMNSFIKLSGVDPGYQPGHVLTFQVALPVDRYPDARLKTFAEDLAAGLRSVPGVRAAAYANQLPMVQLRDTAGGLWKTPDRGRTPAPGGPDARLVSREYLDVMGIRVIAGRGFSERDGAGRPRVLLVNRLLAGRDFPGEDPIGQQVYIGRDPYPWQIVGIVDNVRQFGLDREPEPQFFVDVRQWSGTGPLFPIGAYYAVRADGNPVSVIPNIRAIVRRLDRQAALFNIAPMEQLVTTTIAQPRMYTMLLSIFAGIGATLAVIGIYGVMAYRVTQRTREIGIRMALGARRAQVLALVLRKGVTLTIIGIAVGLVGAAAATRFLQGMLFGITPLDARTFAAVSLLFGLVAMLASYVPARRATKVDPIVALRSE
jgi:predicted permease